MKVRSLKTLLILLALLVPAILISYYFMFKDIKIKNEHISELTSDLLNQSDKQGYLITTERLIQSLNSDIIKINNYIVEQDGDVSFIENLESLARNNGLNITIDSLDIENKPELDSNNVALLKIKAKTKGTWSGTYTFLTELESLPYKTSINNFSMINTSDGISTGKRSSVPQDNWQSSFDIQVLKYK